MHHTGTEKFLLNLSSTMQKWGHKVTVLTYSFYDDNKYVANGSVMGRREFAYRGIRVLAVKYFDYPADFGFGFRDPRIRPIAAEILADEKPDLIHAAHPMRVGEFLEVAHDGGIPYVITLTDFWTMCPKTILYTSKNTLCLGPEQGINCKRSCPELNYESIKLRLNDAGQLLRNAAAVVAPSRFLGSLLTREFAFVVPEIIPYGIDFSNVTRNRREYDSAGDLTVLYAGQLNYHKGVHVLIDAMKRSNSDKLRLKIYGTGPENAVRDFMTMAKGDTRIEFCGVYGEQEIGKIFGGADVVVVPSNWHENNTIVINEAFACNVPVIASNAGGITDRVSDGVNGLLFEMGDAEELSRILSRLVNDPLQLAGLKRNICATSVSTVEQEAFAYEGAYERCLSNPVT
jgi:glycosyltransferase involved in cell wall biosynthesis